MHRELDKFYTKPFVAEGCISTSWPFLHEYDLFIEPSAGAGSFLNALAKQDVLDKTIAYDLVPETSEYDIITSNWFDVVIPEAPEKVAVIGNPPFGKRNFLSKAFIQHAISFDNVTCVAMILPNAWEKHTLQKVFPRSWKLVMSERLDRDSFTLKGENYSVPCVWQVWLKGDKCSEDLRWEENPPTSCKDFVITNNPDEADFFMMGASPSTLKDVEDVQPNNRGYYIKANIDVEMLKNNLLQVPWKELGSATAGGGVFWITKPELVRNYTMFF